jgi:hypothetical protein
LSESETTVIKLTQLKFNILSDPLTQLI